MTTLFRWCLTTLMACGLTSLAAADPITALFYSGTSASPAQGLTMTITSSPDLRFNVEEFFPPLFSPDGRNLLNFNILGPMGMPTFIMFFAAAGLGENLVLGDYPLATNFDPDSSNLPILSVGGNGVGFNKSHGDFSVLDISFLAGQLYSFAADFTVFDDVHPDIEWIYGSFRYNSSVPLNPIPEPKSLWLTSTAVLLTLLLQVKRRSLLFIRRAWRRDCA